MPSGAFVEFAVLEQSRGSNFSADLTAHHFPRIDSEVRNMPSRRYRKNAEECLDRAVQARKSEDTDAWLLIADVWLRLAVESDGLEHHCNENAGTEATALMS